MTLQHKVKWEKLPGQEDLTLELVGGPLSTEPPALLQRAGLLGTRTPEQFATYIRSEIEKWAKVVKASGARVD